MSWHISKTKGTYTYVNIRILIQVYVCMIEEPHNRNLQHNTSKSVRAMRMS